MGDDYEQYAGAGHFRDGTTRAKNAPNPKGAAFTPTTDAAREWEGWGTALKPAHEPICLARKPLSEKSVAANVLKWGTGALNIDGCRIETDWNTDPTRRGWKGQNNGAATFQGERELGGEKCKPNGLGRWPANLVHDGSDEVVAGFPAEAGGRDKREGGNGSRPGGFASIGADSGCNEPNGLLYGDSGSAARFFYCAKANKNDRGDWCKICGAVALKATDTCTCVNGEGGPARGGHPTVKPEALMRYLCRLITPPGGVVFDPFAGSGSTGKAAMLEGFRFIGAELTAEYIPIAQARIAAVAGD
jgi:hypothetical protein